MVRACVLSFRRYAEMNMPKVAPFTGHVEMFQKVGPWTTTRTMVGAEFSGRRNSRLHYTTSERAVRVMPRFVRLSPKSATNSTRHMACRFNGDLLSNMQMKSAVQ